MEESAPRERVQLFDGHGFFALPQAVNRVEQKAIGTGGKLLKRGWRVTARRDALRGQNTKGPFVRVHDPVRARPRPLVPSRGARPERPRQAIVDSQKISCVPLHVLARLMEELFEQGQVVFHVVNRVLWFPWCRPSQPRVRGFGSPLFEVAKRRQAALGGAEHFEGVKRRHPRPSLDRVHSRIRDVKARMGGGRGASQEQPLPGQTLVLRKEPGTELLAVIVEQQRILRRLARKDSFRESRQEDDLK